MRKPSSVRVKYSSGDCNKNQWDPVKNVHPLTGICRVILMDSDEIVVLDPKMELEKK